MARHDRDDPSARKGVQSPHTEPVYLARFVELLLVADVGSNGGRDLPHNEGQGIRVLEAPQGIKGVCFVRPHAHAPTRPRTATTTQHRQHSKR